MNFLTTLENVLVMLLYLSIGFILTKFKKTTGNHLKSLSAILIYVCGPAMILSAFQLVEYTHDNLIKMILFFVASLTVQVLLMVIIYIVIHKKISDARYRILAIAAVCGNCGFFGLPLVQALFKEAPIVSVYSSIFVMTMNLIAFTLGVFLITTKKEYISVKAAIVNPTSLTIIVALPLFFANYKYPTVLGDSISILGKMTTPLCMFILGIRLASVNFINLFRRKFVYIACLLKLVVFPLFAYLCVYFIPGLDYAFKGSILVLSSVPSAALILSLAELHDTEQELCANVVLLSTLLCVITIPFILLIL